jgi:hypothetical protein
MLKSQTPAIANVGASGFCIQLRFKHRFTP